MSAYKETHWIGTGARIEVDWNFETGVIFFDPIHVWGNNHINDMRSMSVQVGGERHYPKDEIIRIITLYQEQYNAYYHSNTGTVR